MATKTEIAGRADRDIEAVLFFNRDLPEILEEWDDLADGERASLSMEWDHLMGSYLAELEDYRRAGALSAAQEDSYRRLREELRDNLPVIERLNFYRPPVDL